MSTAVTAIATIVAVVVGWSLSERSRRQTLELEAARRENDFQRQSLIELQETASDVVNAAHNIQRGRDRDDLELSRSGVQQLQTSLQRLNIVTSRVTEPAVHTAIDPVGESALDVREATTEEAVQEALQQLGEFGHAATVLIGETILSLSPTRPATKRSLSQLWTAASTKMKNIWASISKPAPPESGA